MRKQKKPEGIFHMTDEEFAEEARQIREILDGLDKIEAENRAVLERLKEAAGLKSDARLAKALGISRKDLDCSPLGGFLPYAAIIEYAIRENLSLDLIFKGGDNE